MRYIGLTHMGHNQFGGIAELPLAQPGQLQAHLHLAQLDDRGRRGGAGPWPGRQPGGEVASVGIEGDRRHRRNPEVGGDVDQPGLPVDGVGTEGAESGEGIFVVRHRPRRPFGVGHA